MPGEMTFNFFLDHIATVRDTSPYGLKGSRIRNFFKGGNTKIISLIIKY